VTLDLLRVMVAEALRGPWLGSEPGPGCLDADADSLGRLLRHDPGEDLEAARRHLAVCPRCRYLHVWASRGGCGLVASAELLRAALARSMSEPGPE
jgi:hypothetical protein